MDANKELNAFDLLVKGENVEEKHWNHFERGSFLYAKRMKTELRSAITKSKVVFELDLSTPIKDVALRKSHKIDLWFQVISMYRCHKFSITVYRCIPYNGVHPVL